MSPFWAEGQEIDIIDVSVARIPCSVEREGDIIKGDCEPRAFSWQERIHRILDPATHWRVHTAWWREVEIWRDYWEAATDTGLLCTFYHDLRAGGWRLERVRE